jgi:hypothetical protein
MKIILSVPDEGYFERTWWRLFWAYLMKVILSAPDEGYFERTWLRLFEKLFVRTKFDIYIFIISLNIKTIFYVQQFIYGQHQYGLIVKILDFSIRK